MTRNIHPNVLRPFPLKDVNDGLRQCLGIRSNEHVAVEFKEIDEGDKASPLVALCERMVPANPKQQGRGERR